MAHKITLIPGDGIGPEVSLAAKRCIEATGVKVQWEEVPAGEEALKKYGKVLPDETIASIKKNKVAIKGPVITPIGEGYRSVNVQMRQTLNLYACLRPCKWYEGVKAPYKNIDLAVIRENTEDLYAGIEFEEGKNATRKLLKDINKLSKKTIASDSAISIKPISRKATERIVRFAFEYAIKNKRKKVTCVHKANIMKFTDGLFLKVAKDVARDYEGKIEFEDRLIDNMCMQLVQKPWDYDCLVLPNLYGDIISDLCAGLVGGLGVAPGANIGETCAIFEATHGSAPKYKGKNKVNPVAMILSGVMLLKFIGEEKAAQRLEEAVKEVIKEGKRVTYDLKADKNDPTAAGTSEMADAIIERLK
ncbi:MAG: isocitrate/isopropylmalate dehydrogenase family protein [Candidatus Omnitrophota bacterium]|nr:MAG: isocitrate/isopropylmalate dehydrogenase family protein [Candidatus Omnitrophota bacterium]